MNEYVYKSAHMYIRTVRFRGGPMMPPPPSPTPPPQQRQGLSNGGPSTPAGSIGGPSPPPILRVAWWTLRAKGGHGWTSQVKVMSIGGTPSTPEVAFWWTSHSRGDPLVGIPLQGWGAGGPPTQGKAIWGWRPSFCFSLRICIRTLYI